MDLILALFVCILIAAGISAGIMFFVRGKLKSVRSERTACNYTRKESFKTTKSNDTFLFRNISKIPLPQNNNSGGKRRR